MGKTTRYPKIFNEPVDLSKVDLDRVKKWIDQTLEEEVPEDDVIADYVYELLVNGDEPNAKEIYAQMEEFLGESTMRFVGRLWKVLLEDVKPAKEDATTKQNEETVSKALDSEKTKNPRDSSYSRDPRSHTEYSEYPRDRYQTHRDHRDRDPRDNDPIRRDRDYRNYPSRRDPPYKYSHRNRNHRRNGPPRQFPPRTDEEAPPSKDLRDNLTRF